MTDETEETPEVTEETPEVTDQNNTDPYGDSIDKARHYYDNDQKIGDNVSKDTESAVREFVRESYRTSYGQERMDEVHIQEILEDDLGIKDPKVSEIIHEEIDCIESGNAACSGDSSQQDVHHEADPIMMYNGQFVYEAVDISINGAGINFEFKRIYKNQVYYNGPLGHSWDHSLNLRLRILGIGIYRSTGSGREDLYTKHSDYDYWVPPEGNHDIIIQNGSSYICRTPSGIKYIYNQDVTRPILYKIHRIEDKYGNYLEFRYQNSVLKFVEINNTDRIVEFHYDVSDRIEFIRDYINRVWHYEYDDFGDLISVTTPSTIRYTNGLTMVYEYSSSQFTAPLQHNLIRIIDPADQMYLENEYGIQPGLLNFNRVVSQRQGGGRFFFEYQNVIQEFDYDYSDIDRPVHQTNFFNRNGHPVHFIYNKYGNLIFKEEYIFIKGIKTLIKWRYRYNQDGMLIGSISPEGVITQYLFGRDYYLRKHSITDQDVATHDQLTQQERQAFGNSLAIVKRGKFYNFTNMNFRFGIWSNFFPDILLEIDQNDIILKNTFESSYQQLLTTSDPRYTRSADPHSIVDTGDPYNATLTKFEFVDGPLGEQNFFLSQINYPAASQPDDTPLLDIKDEFPEYDARGRIKKKIDPEGIETEYEYYDNIVKFKEGYLKKEIVDPSGLNIITEYEVNEIGIKTSILAPKATTGPPGSFRTIYNVNELNQITDITSSPPFSYKIKTYYDKNSQIEKEEIDLLDDLTTPILGGKEIRTYLYDEQFNLLKETVGGVDPFTHLTTSYIYNESDKLICNILPKGNRINRKYDERLLENEFIRGPNSLIESKTKKVYNKDGIIKSLIDGMGNILEYRYDSFNRIIETVDPHGNVLRVDYDKMGNLILERFFELQEDGSFHIMTRKENEFNEINQLIKSKTNLFPNPLPIGDIERDYYDPPLPLSITVFKSIYDKKSRLRQINNQNDQITVYNYDKMDRLIQEIEIRNSNIEVFIENTYDDNGNLTRRDTTERVVDPIGEDRVEIFSFIYEFDELDRKTKVTDSLGNSTLLFYDSRNRVVKTKDPLGNVIRTNYDIFGRKIETISKMTDNGLGGGIWVSDKKVISEFDDNGNIAANFDANNNRTEHKYDELDRKEKIVFPDDSYQEFKYDANDNVIYLKDNNGLIHNNVYDEKNRLKRKSIDRSELRAGVVIEGATFEEFDYDGLNRIKLEENDVTLITRLYDSLSRNYKESITFQGAANDGLGQHEIKRKFDNLNYLTEITYPKGRKIKYHLDSLNRIKKIENITRGASYPGSVTFHDPYEILSNEYFGLRKSSIKNANNTSVKFGFDAAGRKIQITHSEGNTEKLRIQYLYDGASNLRYKNEIDVSGKIYRYNSLYWLSKIEDNDNLPDQTISTYAPYTVWKDPAHLNGQTLIDVQLGILDLDLADLTFSYDLNGNRTRENDPLTWPSLFQINDLNQYKTIDAELYTHDLNGNLKTGTLKPGSNFAFYYNYNNQLVRIHDLTTDADIAGFSYDTRRRRIFSDIGGNKTHHIFNGQNLIEEYRAGNIWAQYVNEYNLDSVRQMVVGGKEFWYHKDLVHSTRFLSDESNNFVVDYQYNHFGAPLNNPPQYNPFRFMSRRFDEEIDSYHFRLRQYSPDLGRFFQRDIIPSENLYWFLDNNPLNGLDPMGTKRISQKFEESDAQKIVRFFLPQTLQIEEMRGKEEIQEELNEVFRQIEEMRGQEKEKFQEELNEVFRQIEEMRGQEEVMEDAKKMWYNIFNKLARDKELERELRKEMGNENYNKYQKRLKQFEQRQRKEMGDENYYKGQKELEQELELLKQQ